MANKLLATLNANSAKVQESLNKTREDLAGQFENVNKNLTAINKTLNKPPKEPAVPKGKGKGDLLGGVPGKPKLPKDPTTKKPPKLGKGGQAKKALLSNKAISGMVKGLAKLGPIGVAVGVAAAIAVKGIQVAVRTVSEAIKTVSQIGVENAEAVSTALTGSLKDLTAAAVKSSKLTAAASLEMARTSNVATLQNIRYAKSLSATAVILAKAQREQIQDPKTIAHMKEMAEFSRLNAKNMATMTKNFAPLKRAMTRVFAAMQIFFGDLLSSFSKVFADVIRFITPILMVLARVFGILGKVIKLVFKVIGISIKLMIKRLLFIPNLILKIARALNIIPDSIKTIADVWAAVWNPILDGFEFVIAIVNDLVRGFNGQSSVLLDPMKDFFKDMVNILNPFKGRAKPDPISNVPKEVPEGLTKKDLTLLVAPLSPRPSGTVTNNGGGTITNDNRAPVDNRVVIVNADQSINIEELIDSAEGFERQAQ